MPDGNGRTNVVAANNMNAVTSNAVSQNVLKIISRAESADSDEWGSFIFNEEGPHIYVVIANRWSTAHNLFAIINTWGAKDNKEIYPTILVNTDNAFTMQYNAIGTLAIYYSADPVNQFHYSYCVYKLI